MKLRSVTSWTTRDGKRRRIRLFEAWRNMLGRCRGSKSRTPGKYWTAGCDFDSWCGFRDWALRHGFGIGRELDRKDSTLPYSQENCQWLLRADHWAKTRAARKDAERRHTRRTTSVRWPLHHPDPEVPF